MRWLTIASCVIVAAGCAKSEQQAAKTSISLADVAGTWTMRTMPQDGDSVLVTFDMVAGADTAGWAFHFPQREPVPVRVLAVEGDSIVTEAGPYASVLREGIQVTTHSVMRLQDGKLVGHVVARYTPAGADSVVMLRTEGTRVP